MVRQLRQPVVVRVIGEEIGVCVGIPQTGMEMTAVPRQMGKRLGHKGRNESILLSNSSHHPTKEGMAIGCRQTIRIRPIDFKLAVGVFVVIGIRVPAQFLHVFQQRCHKVKITGECAQVVAGFVQGIEWIVGGIRSSVRLTGQNELWLDPRLEDIPLLARCGQLAPAVLYADSRATVRH